MKLYVNRPSPYGRKALVAAIEGRLETEMEIVQIDPWKNDPEFLAIVPAGRVPALVLADGSVLLESTAIAQHLLSIGGPDEKVPGELTVTQRTGLAQALMDAGYSTVIERRRPQAVQWEAWIGRQQAAIGRILSAFEVPPDNRFDLGDITLACALDYLNFRLPESPWNVQRPDLHNWLDLIGRRPSMVASDPRQP